MLELGNDIQSNDKNMKTNLQNLQYKNSSHRPLLYKHHKSSNMVSDQSLYRALTPFVISATISSATLSPFVSFASTPLVSVPVVSFASTPLVLAPFVSSCCSASCANSSLISFAALVPSSIAPSINDLHPSAVSELAKKMLPCFALKSSR